MDTKYSANRTRAVRLFAAATLMCGGLLMMGLGRPGVVTIKVTGTSDVLADDGVCTLREAIIAANTNTPSGETRGECPAGQDAQKDIITLASGAIYSLAIDSTPDEDAAQDGDLDIWDNAATTDLIIGVEGGGTATISQDAAVDERVLHILGAMVKIEGLILTGGATLNDGGGVAVHGGVLTTGPRSLATRRAGVGVSLPGTARSRWIAALYLATLPAKTRAAS